MKRSHEWGMRVCEKEDEMDAHPEKRKWTFCRFHRRDVREGTANSNYQ